MATATVPTVRIQSKAAKLAGGFPIDLEAQGEITQWADAPPARYEEQELNILAFLAWQRSSCPETDFDSVFTEEEALRCRASCL